MPEFPARNVRNGKKPPGSAVSPADAGATTPEIPQVVVEANEWLSVMKHMHGYLEQASGWLVEAQEPGTPEGCAWAQVERAEDILRLLVEAIGKALESKVAREEARNA